MAALPANRGQAPGLADINGFAQDEVDLLFFFGTDHNGGLDRRAGIETDADIAREFTAYTCGRRRKRAVAAQEFRAISRQGTRPLTHVGKGDLIREVGVEGVAGQQRPRLGISFCHDMGCHLIAVRPQHPLGIIKDAKPARP